MGTREAQLHIQVVDGSGNVRAPGVSDKVTVDGRDLAFDSAKGFVHKVATSGDIEVRISYKGFAELRQHFAVRSQVEKPTVLPFWPGSRKDITDTGRREGFLLECMELHRVSGGAGDQRAPKIFPITVTLQETREHVAVVGTDYWEQGSHPHQTHLPFDKAAETFAYHLFVTKVTNASSPHTVLDCQQGRKEVWMRAHRKGWQPQFVIEKKKVAPKWPNNRSFLDWLDAVGDSTDLSEKASDYIGAVDVYQYLHEVGTDRPKTVIDFGIFSHAFDGGPVLYNTLSTTNSASPWISVRDPNDLDMRKWQDFHAANTAFWMNMKRAFMADAQIHVWGCLATTIYKQMIDYLRAGWHETRDGKFFVRPDAGDPPMTPLTRAEVVTKMKDVIAIPTWV
jgi:hypothetical protein